MADVEKDAFGDTKLPKRKRPEGEVVSAGARKWNFENDPVLEGSFHSKIVWEKDSPEHNAKKGDVMGFNFVTTTGELVAVSASFAIKKALEDKLFSTKIQWWIEFVEKTTVKGKPFNNFYIQTVK